jgi:hypothetical protein
MQMQSVAAPLRVGALTLDARLMARDLSGEEFQSVNVDAVKFTTQPDLY